MIKGEGKKYTVNGVSLTLREWSERLGVKYSTLQTRLLKFGRDKKGLKLALTSESYRWVSASTLITHKGETRNLTQWAEIAGISRDLLAHRLKSGWSMDRALREKPMPMQERGARHGKVVEVDGIKDTQSGHCRRVGLSIPGFKNRRKKGKSILAAITEPIMSKAESTEKARSICWQESRRRKMAAAGIAII